MIGLIVSLSCIAVADQTIKYLLRRRLGSKVLSLGVCGQLRIVGHRLWLNRLPRRPSVTQMWMLFAVAAAPLIVLSAAVPACGAFAGLMLGGALSNGLESTTRGSVSDYVCLSFWPAFNLADVALTAGGFGIVLRTVEHLTWK